MIAVDRITDTSQVDAWRVSRWGKFTASEIHRLTLPGKEDKKTGYKELFSPGGITYIEEVATEAFTLYNERDTQFETQAMRNGKHDEWLAFSHLYKFMNFKELEYYGGANPIFEHYCPDSGASPDSLARANGKVSFGAELKCPTSKIHFFYLRKIRNVEQLKQQCYEHWCQIQFGMLTFKCEHWLWCSFNEFFPGQKKMVIIEVPFDKAWADNMEIRLKQAVKMKYQFIQEAETN